MVAVSEDTTANLIDLWNRSELLLRHGTTVFSIGFSPDGRYVVTGSRDRMARLWDAESGQLAAPAYWHTGTVSQVLFSPFSNKLLTKSLDTIWIWSTKDELITRRIPENENIRLINWSNDLQRLVTVVDTPFGTNEAKVWDVATGQRSASAPNVISTSPISQAILNNDGSRLATIAESDFDTLSDQTSANDASIQIWSEANTNPIPIDLKKEFMDQKYSVGHVRFSSTNPERLLLIARGRKDECCRAFVFKSDSKSLQKIWESRKQNESEFCNKSSVLFATFDETAQFILTAGGQETPRSGFVSVWTESEMVIEITDFFEPVTFAAIKRIRNKQFLLTVSGDNAQIWDIDETTAGRQTRPMSHTADIESAQFSPDGSHVVTASKDQTAKIWKLNKSGHLDEHATLIHDSGVTSTAFSDDGEFVATATLDNTIRIWHVQSGNLISVRRDRGRVAVISFTAEDHLFSISVPTTKISMGLVSFEEYLPRRNVDLNFWKLGLPLDIAPEDLPKYISLISAREFETDRIVLSKPETMVQNFKKLRKNLHSRFSVPPVEEFASVETQRCETEGRWYAAQWYAELSNQLTSGTSGKNPADQIRFQSRWWEQRGISARQVAGEFTYGESDLSAYGDQDATSTAISNSLICFNNALRLDDSRWQLFARRAEIRLQELQNSIDGYLQPYGWDTPPAGNTRENPALMQASSDWRMANQMIDKAQDIPWPLHLVRGHIHGLLNEKNEQIDQYRLAASRSTNNVQPHLKYAQSLREVYTQLLDSPNPEHLDLLKDSLESLAKAHRVEPKNRFVQELLARTYYEVALENILLDQKRGIHEYVEPFLAFAESADLSIVRSWGRRFGMIMQLQNGSEIQPLMRNLNVQPLIWAVALRHKSNTRRIARIADWEENNNADESTEIDVTLRGAWYYRDGQLDNARRYLLEAKNQFDSQTNRLEKVFRNYQESAVAQDVWHAKAVLLLSLVEGNSSNQQLANEYFSEFSSLYSSYLSRRPKLFSGIIDTEWPDLFELKLLLTDAQRLGFDTNKLERQRQESLESNSWIDYILKYLKFN